MKCPDRFPLRAYPGTLRPLLFVGALTSVMAATLPVRAQEKTDGDLLQITITNPNRNLLKVAIPNASGSGEQATTATNIMRRDLAMVGLFQILEPSSFPPALHSEGQGFSSALWSQVGAQAVIKIKAVADPSGALIDGRLYQLGRGEQATLAKSYKGADLRTLVHTFANEVIKVLTGEDGVFGSRIVFARPKLELMSVGMDGEQPAVHTNMRSDSLLPAFSRGGDRIAFTNYLAGTPDLWIVAARGGRARRVSKQQGMNTGASFMPDGNSLVLTLSYQGNADLYRIDTQNGTIQKRLTNNPAIDSSAAVSPDGSQIAFVSNRQGTPQIFLMAASGDGARRLTYKGNYNQTPAWNPRKDKPMIAFTARDERGSFDIFGVDVRDGKIVRYTQNRGSNFDPSWSPDGRLLVYGSSRGGLFVLNPETQNEFQIWKGKARSPSWGPPPRP